MSGRSAELLSQPFIHRFGDTFDSFIQVLVDEFILSRNEAGISLEFGIDNRKMSIRDPRARRDLSNFIKDHSKEGARYLEQQLSNFNSDKNTLSYRFECPRNPFRYANGGVLPIIQIDQDYYFCLFYRAIFPVGWNIANGASNDIDDIRNPSRIIHREFSEEFIIADHKEGILYIFDAYNDETMRGTQELALDLWSKELKNPGLKDYKREPIPLKWIEGHDTVKCRYGSAYHTHDGFFVNVTPEDNAIEVDKIALINLMGEFSFYDGEVEFNKKTEAGSEGILLDRPIGFFKVDEFLKAQDSKKFVPDFFYHSGKRYNEWSQFQEVLERDYFPRHRAMGIRPDKLHKSYELAVRNHTEFNLCPITRAVINKYADWKDNEETSLERLQITAEPKPEISSEEKPFQIFISFNSKDQALAELLYDFLRDKGYEVFCSSKSIQLLGISAYQKAIDKALISSKCMIVIGSEPDSFDSGWVEYEWGSFLMLINSRRKEGEIFTLTQNMDPRDLPFGLQSRENIQLSEYSLELSFNNFFVYIKEAMTRLNQ